MLARVVAVAAATTIAASAASVAPSLAWADGMSVTSVSPASAPMGSTISVQGSGLATVTDVVFAGGAHAAPATTPTDSDVQVVVPAGAQSGAVTVTDGSNQAVSPSTLDITETGTLSASLTSLIYPATSTLTATLTSGTVPLAGQPATLQSQPAGQSAWRNGPQATTDSNGQVRFTVKPLASTSYRVSFDPTTAYAGAVTNAVTIRQHPVVTLSLPTVAPILTKLRVKGAVKPAQSGVVKLERRDKGSWHAVGTAKLDKKSHYAFTVTLPAKAAYTYRVRRPSDVHQAGNLSPAEKVLGVNRTLHSGESGSDVTALQKRLAALHYDVGRITGSYNFDTFHAVVAFQKVQGINRDGVVGPKVWSKLATPRVPRLRHPLAGANGVEVDLTRQVLYYGVKGKIARIFDSSTGGGYYYTGSDGTTQQAITPTGHFSVKYKVNGWVRSKLGVLWRPAYFNYDGYAIHGEPEVPSYPASHGCVRITVPAMDRFYGKLVNGLSVWIYRS